jgi:hypothetical protein
MAAAVYKDRVKDTSATTGTGTYTLNNSPPTGFQAFSVVGDGNTCNYLATDGVDWEVGQGVYTDSTKTLTRALILASSNSGSAVSWSGAGPRTVALVLPASIAQLFARKDLAGQVITVGVTVTPTDLGTFSSGTCTVDPSACPIQKVVHGAGGFAFDIAANCNQCIVEMTNSSASGSITTSAIDKMVGDAFDNTTGSVFLCLFMYTPAGKKTLQVWKIV